MQVLDPGHRYLLDVLDAMYPGEDAEKQEVQFVKRVGEGYPGNEGALPGTTLQETLRMGINRLEYVNNQIPDANNQAAITHLEWAIWHLEKRAFERHNQPFDLSPQGIDKLPVNLRGHLWHEDVTKV